jgi:hypothetical protein
MDNLIGDRDNQPTNITRKIEIMNLFYYIQDYEKLKMKMWISGECTNIKSRIYNSALKSAIIGRDL